MIRASLFSLTFLLCSLPLQAREPVHVGVYDYQPFYQAIGEGHAGPIPDLVALLNTEQQEFEFELTPTTSRRRYQDFADGKFDMIFFESKAWGWQDYPLQASEPVFHGGEVWVALVEPGRDQSFFTDMTDKTLLGVLGYHYGFANFNSDPDYLRQNYDMHLVDNQNKIIELLLQDRADMGLIAYSYLNNYLHHHPEVRPQLIVSNFFDQEYRHGALLRQGIKLDLARLNALFERLKASGQLDKIWQKHHLVHLGAPRQ
ncbi:transporter substrate-binding domain-containing protein [Aliiglaciecola sp. CAU 1673]|uniref:substrate-binding periplasmic protein n=1 Tax=Aliiglaciecola sp. CAU 1673 TaxID=3032595 RepID=UPI0023DA95E6|nr:transporter substrate-binding domain-containing protein [Aliiglaciecola sp. CAU 1673]MDF2180290.1 transporter substrate-binding domain-containing protein [Aliiglaciecola sp. CAU 1673]